MPIITNSIIRPFKLVSCKGKLFIAIICCMSVTVLGQQKKSGEDTPNEKKISDILQQLTLDEKISLCSGAQGLNAFKGVPRLKIPDILLSDGPRGPNRGGPATAFPSGIAFGSTWDPELIKRAGEVMGKESRAKGFGVLLAPGVNILRDPLNGRFFEYYTEDPFLNSALAVADIQGIQSAGVAACLKHYACNNREDNRNFYMSMVDERTLNEIYLPAFKAAVQKANVLTVMTSANGVNGEYSSDSKELLSGILKRKWGFKGLVMTDWLQTRSTEKAAFAGLDISMPGGVDCMFGNALLRAVKEGRVPIKIIDDKVRRILRVYASIGMLEKPQSPNSKDLNTLANQLVAKQVAEQAMVLLKNENSVLPLQVAKIKKVLVLGPNADKLLNYSGAGGSSGIVPPFEITPLKGLINYLGADKVEYMSTEDLGGFQVIPKNDILNSDGTKGFKALYYDVKNSGHPAVSRLDSAIDFMWEMKSPDPRIEPTHFSKATYTAKLIPPMDGKYTIRLIVNGIANMYHGSLNGQHLAFADSRQTLNITNSSILLKKGEPYEISIQYEKEPGDAAIRLEWELPEANIEKINALKKEAASADAVIYFAGIDHSMDTEGRDRKDINFPGAQENQLNLLAKENKNTIAVLINGSPLQLGGWLQNVPAVLEAWYPGMESGNAIADILFGKTNPSGKLSFSWPKKLEDVPCKILGTENNDEVFYTDSLLVGYRYYDTKKESPEFPFGFGLSYTIFKYGKLKVRKYGKIVTGRVTITNIGQADGSEVVQFYVKPLRPGIFRPVHELKGFKKIFLKKGQFHEVDFIMHQDAFSYFDAKSHNWRVDKGNYVIEAASSSRDIRSSVKITY